ncbi:MAG TPA: 3-hydroxyacyl-CoA dehydrogenase family protein [Ktedonobacteraceae bacterium]|nr:3-hydroxyacyl-CoA dehydrogenase family protein [Ktedonobacteraceae bacterium]
MSIRNLGVVGAGVMGRGIAQTVAQAGLPVVLLDLSENILQEARQDIARHTRLQQLWQKVPNSEPIDNILDRIVLTTAYSSFGAVDVVIENTPENIETKRSVYQRLDAICPPHCVLASNTSAISITRIGSWTNRSDKVIGMHFMNPAPMKTMVEVARGYHTSEETIEIARKLLSYLGKDLILVNDMPGFVSNRVLMLTINEAIFLVQDQVATVEAIDNIFKSCFGHKMGPLETADLIGLDTILFSIKVLYESYCDSKYRPCPLLQKMVEAGRYGCKSGQGFYKYV